MDICPGTTLGHYELLVPIATGGMAQVWAARQHGSRGFSKTVAVKLLLTELIDDISFQQMFLDEAELAARIKHPNVAEILDLGEQGGVLYQVMEYVDGEPLHAVLREQKGEMGLPLDLAARIVSQACAGLHAAHELKDADGRYLNLVHRDVTPQNLLVTYEGQLKILDFGVAKATSNLQQTSVGQMKGKIPYMAPEQARGEPVDRRTDVFALGVVLYQLTTGRHPFRGDNDLITLRAITASTPVAPPEDMIEGFPEELNEVIVRALAKDRNDRFESMEAMGEALDRAALRLPIGTEDLGAFMRRLLGRRGEARRAAIRDAAHAVSGETATSTPLPSVSTPIPGMAGSVALPVDDEATLVQFVPPQHHNLEPAPPPVPQRRPEPTRRMPEPKPGVFPPPATPTNRGVGPGAPRESSPFAPPPFVGPSPASPAPAPPALPAPAPPAPPQAPPPAMDVRPAPEPALEIAPAVERPIQSVPPMSALDQDLERLAAATPGGGQSKSAIAGLVALVVLALVIIVAISMAPDSDAPEIPVVPAPPAGT